MVPVAVRSLVTVRLQTQNAVVGQSGRLNSHRHTWHDKTVANACRPPPPRRRPGRQLRLAARPPTRSDVVCHENVDTLWTVAYDQTKISSLNARRRGWSIGWLSRLCQTVSRLNSHRLTRRRHDRLVLSGGRCKLGISLVTFWQSPDRLWQCCGNTWL